VLRRESRYREKLALVAWPAEPEPDDRLGLIFTCCHPALPRAGQVALTLRVVCGLTAAQIARAFLIPESTVGQRITRAKRKISDAGNEGYLCSGGRHAQSRDLTDDAEFLPALLDGLMPTEPEVAGLLALIRLHRARAAARFDQDSEIIQLQRQDRSLWDRDVIADAGRMIARAAALKRPGPYQLQAAIVACHADAERWEDTDWTQIVVLYDMLLYLAPSPVTRLHRAIALRYVTGPAAALREVEALADDLSGYHLFHATRAELLRDLGHTDQAQAAYARALALTDNPAQRSLLRHRLNWT